MTTLTESDLQLIEIWNTIELPQSLCDSMRPNIEKIRKKIKAEKLTK